MRFPLAHLAGARTNPGDVGGHQGRVWSQPTAHPEGLPACICHPTTAPRGPGWSLSVAGFPLLLYWDFAGEESGPGGLGWNPQGMPWSPCIMGQWSQAPAWTGGVMA